MFQATGSPQYKAAILVRTKRELQTLTDLDLVDRQWIIKAVRGALTSGVTDSDAANTVLADAITRNTAELVDLLDEVVDRALVQCGTAPPFPFAGDSVCEFSVGISTRQSHER